MKKVGDARDIENWHRTLTESGTSLTTLNIELEAMSSGTYIAELEETLRTDHEEILKSDLKKASPTRDAKEAQDAINKLYEAPKPESITDLQNFSRSLEALTSVKTQHYDRRREAYDKFSAETQDNFIGHLEAVKKELNIVISRMGQAEETT